MMKKFKFFLVLGLTLILSGSLWAADLTLDQLMAKMQAGQGKIKDMYAEILTTITSNISAGGRQTSKQNQTITQKAKMWTKGKDKSRMEMLTTPKQITITNGTKMAIIDQESGRRVVQDLSKQKTSQSFGQNSGMDLAKAKQMFDLSLKKDSAGNYIIIGQPKKSNQFIGKMAFEVNAKTFLPTKISIYTPVGQLMNQSKITYQKVSGLWVPATTVSNVDTPAGKMKVELAYNNVKVNQGIKDNLFKVE